MHSDAPFTMILIVELCALLEERERERGHGHWVDFPDFGNCCDFSSVF